MESGQTVKGEKDILFKHFCNCLYFGQWELAKACGRLFREKTAGNEADDVLLDLAKFPFNRR